MKLAARILKCFDRLAAEGRAPAGPSPAPAPPVDSDVADAGAEAIERAESVIDIAEQIERNIASMVFRAAELLAETQTAAQRRADDAAAPNEDHDGPIDADAPDRAAPLTVEARPAPADDDDDDDDHRDDDDDLAELREMNRELRTQLAAVEEQYDRLVAFQSIHDESEDLTARVLATVSDEIRTPIETIARLVELIAETGLDRAQRGYLAETRSAIGSLQELMQCVPGAPDQAAPPEACPYEARGSRSQSSASTAARSEARDHDPSDSPVEPFDLDALLQGVVNELAPAADRKGIRIATSVECAAPGLFGDRARLRQALLYALTRAVQCAA